MRARRNFWNKFNAFGASVAPAPDEYLLVKSSSASNCGVGNLVSLSADPVATAYNSACPIDGGIGGKASAGISTPGRHWLQNGTQTRLLSDKDCELGGIDLRAQFEAAWAAFHTAYDQVAYTDTEPDMSAALVFFDPIADFDSTQLVSADAICRQYVQVSQVFAGPEGQFKPESKVNSRWNTVGDNRIHISPNPAQISFKVSLPDSSCTIRVWNAVGRLIHEVNAVSASSVVDVSEWATGVYLIEVNSAEGKSWGKVVVKR